MSLHVGQVLIPSWEFYFESARSSGPGGQHVNKTETKMSLIWNPVDSPSLSGDIKARFLSRFGSRLDEDGILRITSQSHRSQDMNRRACIEKLKQMIESVLFPPKKRIRTRPTVASRKKRLEGKVRRGDIKKSRRKVSYS